MQERPQQLQQTQLQIATEEDLGLRSTKFRHQGKEQKVMARSRATLTYVCRFLETKD